MINNKYLFLMVGLFFLSFSLSGCGEPNSGPSDPNKGKVNLSIEWRNPEIRSPESVVYVDVGLLKRPLGPMSITSARREYDNPKVTLDSALSDRSALLGLVDADKSPEELVKLIDASLTSQEAKSSASVEIGPGRYYLVSSRLCWRNPEIYAEISDETLNVEAGRSVKRTLSIWCPAP